MQWENDVIAEQPLQEQAKFGHAIHMLDDAIHSRDTVMNNGNGNNNQQAQHHQNDRKKSQAMIDRDNLRQSIHAHIRHRTSSADEHIETVEKRLTSKLNLCFADRKKIMSMQTLEEGSEEEDST